MSRDELLTELTVERFGPVPVTTSIRRFERQRTGRTAVQAARLQRLADATKEDE